MENKIIDSQEEMFLIDVLSNIVPNIRGRIPTASKRIDELEKYLYTLSILSDDYSRELYLRILTRMIACEFIDKDIAAELFPIWSEEFAAEYELKKKTVVLPDLKHPNDAGSKIILPETFWTPAYNYHDICCVQENDVVFDIGAWIGDTAYVFSRKMKGTGMIYGFEPMPQNYDLLAENSRLIPNLRIYNLGLGKGDGVLKFTFPEWGAASGSSRCDANGEYEVKIKTLDSFVKENNIEKVDFIKADIEGAECDMLLGAAETIRRFHPRLAICIYHRGQIDHYEVPSVILSIRQDYEFFIEAFKDGLTETVLFAIPVEKAPDRLPAGSIKVSEHIKTLYKSVHEKFYNDYVDELIKSFMECLENYTKYKFEWDITANWLKMYLKNNRKIHYKLLFRNNSTDVLLVFDKFEDYSETHKNKIREILDNFLDVHSDYNSVSNERGIYIVKQLPLQLASADNLACNMAVLINETIAPLWENGIVDPECVKPLLYNGGSPSGHISPPPAEVNILIFITDLRRIHICNLTT